MNNPKVILRADGSSQMGLGHVIRSMALADMLREEFDTTFIIRNPLPTIKTQLLQVCHQVIELPDTDNDISEAQELTQDYLKGDEIIVLDGYHFVTEYQQIIREKGCKLVCIDDIHTYHFVADAVINHAGGVSSTHYSTEPYTQLCLGPRYALLRKPFREAARNRNYPDRQDTSIFICLGGADPDNTTLQIVKECEEVTFIKKCYVITGAAYQHKDILQDHIAKSKIPIELLSNLSAQEMAHYMKKCGMAVTPPSTVSYEYLSVGGILYLKTIADNQKDMHKFFVEENLALDFSTIKTVNAEKEKTTREDQLIFNGDQQKRLLRVFYSLALKPRRATEDDLMLYYQWANDPMARQQSFNSEPICLDTHTDWFSKKVTSPSAVLYVMELDGQSAGQIRFDLSEDTATISYSVGSDYRGKGLGESILRAGVSQFRKKYRGKYTIIGYVKKSNIASAKAFRAIGSREVEALEHTDSYKYVLNERI